MTGDALLTSRIDARGVATLTMSRQSVANAFDDSLIAVLTDELELAAEDSAIRAVVLTGAGEHFSAGADLAWMKQMASASEADNLEDARALSPPDADAGRASPSRRSRGCRARRSAAARVSWRAAISPSARRRRSSRSPRSGSA